MTVQQLQADYVVVGAGAAAMAFVDTLLSEDASATVLIVDGHDRPGGHWNDAYSFVRLHQPSEFYGVVSRELSTHTRDVVGFNAGLSTTASRAQVLAYFDQLMQQRFLPSGRVRWLPMTHYDRAPDGTHRVRSLTSGQSWQVSVKRKRVDATLARTAVPATHPPGYRVAGDVRCVPLNDLPRITREYPVYTVVGSGKTGIDACLWLLENGVPPARIRWVVPRDAWFVNRANFQPGREYCERSLGIILAQMDAIAQAQSVPDLLTRLESLGVLLRLDPTVMPSTYRCATVSDGELNALRRIGEIVRLGRVQVIEPYQLQLTHGCLAADPDTLYVDCSASALAAPPRLPIFEPDGINLLMVRNCQPTFSAAVIAYVECHVSDLAARNALCRPVPSPEFPVDWLRMWAATMGNTGQWRQHEGLSNWLQHCRLNFIHTFLREVPPHDTRARDLVAQMGPKARAALERVPALLAAAP